MVGRRTSTVALRFTALRLQLDPLCRFFCRRSAGSERVSIHSFLTTDLPCRSPPTADAQKIDLADPSQIPLARADGGRTNCPSKAVSFVRHSRCNAV